MIRIIKKAKQKKKITFLFLQFSSFDQIDETYRKEQSYKKKKDFYINVK